MQDKVISLNHVSKRFSKGQQTLLKEALLDIFRKGNKDEFWALKDVSFTIEKGETVGIVGKNGSGKSTLLKIIAGVMYPSSGDVAVNGRVSPLIELGAGFNAELSGRENVYLNGTILGLSKKEIDERFNSIVDFAELGEFMDMPVKHYSSGMYMRLGFSVAVHTEPKILLVDEILAVGDTAFQEKCFLKMEEFKKRGVTIVLISHSETQVEKFCDRAIILKQGKVVFDGDTKKAFVEYKATI